MNYSQFSSSILILYIEEVGGVLLALFLAVLIGAYSIKNLTKEYKKHHDFKACFCGNTNSIIDFVGIALSVILLCVILAFPAKDVIADIPHLIKKDFSVTTGMVVSQDAAGNETTMENRGFEIEDINSGEIIKITVFHTLIKQGEFYEVVYLPHTGNGAIVKKLDSDNRNTVRNHLQETE